MPDPKDIIREAAEQLEGVAESVRSGDSLVPYWMTLHGVKGCERWAAALRTLLTGVWLDRETAERMVLALEWSADNGFFPLGGEDDFRNFATTIRHQLDESKEGNDEDRR